MPERAVSAGRGYAEMATPMREDRAEAAKLERRLSDLVDRAYGLTPEDVDLLWSTAPDAQSLRKIPQARHRLPGCLRYSAVSTSGLTHILTDCSPAA